MTSNPIIFPKTENHWETPNELFQRLHKEFNFKWDICAENFNAKLPLHYTPKNSCLEHDWELDSWLFINPPYNPLKPFIAKCNEQAQRGCKIVALIPIQTMANQYFDDSCVSEIRIVKGRIKFEANGGKTGGTPRHCSAIIVYDKQSKGEQIQLSRIVA